MGNRHSALQFLTTGTYAISITFTDIEGLWFESVETNDLLWAATYAGDPWIFLDFAAVEGRRDMAFVLYGISAPIPAPIGLFLSGLLVTVGLARRKR